jgi:dTDP-glucose pyrophosphorylase
MKILIPAAGAGSRFHDAGFTFPKPLIPVHGAPMIQRVVENLPFHDAEYIFIIRKEHQDKYDMHSMLRAGLQGKCRNVKVIMQEEKLEGAAHTALLAKEYINDDEELLIANSDQIMEYSIENFKLLCDWASPDGVVFVFHDTHPKWSFVKLDNEGKVCEVAEKVPISNIATTGVYFYRKGSDFIKYAEQMIEKNIRVKGEFYIAPVYNELIADGKALLPFFVEKMWGVGTPEDLVEYLNNRG